ncbi:diguanylate cyclase (GGDEF) domain-containing protein [Amycolatopsis lurida]|uniref:MFS transporter n=1 Tax=Amycolatopsis lurida TaxID=31959 RepID=UPI00089CA9B2|nr:MFS transporter [Amycolatopsis lurida]SEE26847.1 diguanylate cyclase (GGDEF) domain-containing protein [Amycolatopsis lurida]
MAERRRAGFAVPLRNPEFRALWVAELLSIGGDQIARVALSLLVFTETSSAALTALTYALTFIPSVLGGFLLSGLADRYPRRAILVVTDVVRAVLAAAMALPGLPLPVLWACVAVLSAAAGPFKAAQSALMPQVLGREGFPAGLALRQFTGQVAQVVAFGSGGLVLTLIEPHLGMLVNAGTFVLSALIILKGVSLRSVSRAATEQEEQVHAPARTWVLLYALVLLVGVYVVPEGLAVPYGHALGISAFGIGLLLAADPLGSAIGAWLTTRFRLPATPLTALLFAVVAGVPLAACVFEPGVVASIVLWAVSGAVSTAFLIQVQTVVVDLVPDARRGGVMGRMSTCLHCSQGIAILGGGVAAQQFGPFRAVAAAGAVAIGVAAGISMLRVLTRSRQRAGSEHGSANEDARDHQSLLVIDEPSSQRTDCLDGPPAENTPTTASAGGPPGDASDSSMQVSTSDVASEAPGDTERIWNVTRWKLWSLRRRVVAFVLAVEIAAVVLTLLLDGFMQVSRSDLFRFGVLVVLGLLAAEVTRVVEQMRRRFSDTPHVNMSSVWTLAAALLVTPTLAAATAVILYGHMRWRSWRRVSGMCLYRVVFSASSVVVSCCSAIALARWLPAVQALENIDDGALLGLAVVVVCYWLVNSALVGGVIALSPGRRSVGALVGSWSENSLEFATLCVGVLVTLLMVWHPLALVFVMLPLYVLTRSVLVRQLEAAATTDRKTGLLNAETWKTLAENEVAKARRHHAPIGVLMIDVDKFKSVNDTYGHIVGDKVLREIAQAIVGNVRSYDIAARFGGEEFVVLLPNADTAASVGIADRVCEAIREMKFADELGDLRLSVSIGVAAYPEAGEALNDVLVAADNVLFAAKDAGRDRVRSLMPDPRRTASAKAD